MIGLSRSGHDPEALKEGKRADESIRKLLSDLGYEVGEFEWLEACEKEALENPRELPIP